MGPARGAPGKLSSSNLCHVIFISEDDVSTLCLGFVGVSRGGSHSRFCITPKLMGKDTCGVSSHRSSKMDVPPNTFWIPGGAIANKLTARTEPFLRLSEMSQTDEEYIRSGPTTVARWPERFQVILDRMTKRARPSLSPIPRPSRATSPSLLLTNDTDDEDSNHSQVQEMVIDAPPTLDLNLG